MRAQFVADARTVERVDGRQIDDFGEAVLTHETRKIVGRLDSHGRKQLGPLKRQRIGRGRAINQHNCLELRVQPPARRTMPEQCKHRPTYASMASDDQRAPI